MRKLALTLAVFCFVPSARAQEAAGTVTRSAQAPDGKNEISTQMGFQASLGATTPAGLRFDFDYARKLTNIVWLDFKLDPIFGVGPTSRRCYDGSYYDCSSAGAFDGHEIDLMGGIKLKFPIARVPQLLPYAQIAMGAAIIFSRPYHDDSAGLVFHTGGGVKYFVTRHVGLGGEIGFTLGPAWYSATCPTCNDSHTELYRAFDFALGAEFIL